MAGCSWIFVDPLPASYAPGDHAHCTTDRTAPVVDTLFTITNLASTAYVASEDTVANKGTVVGVGVAAAGLWFASALYGYVHTSDCVAAKADEDGRPHRFGPPRP